MDVFRSKIAKVIFALLLVVLAGSIAGTTLVMARGKGEFDAIAVTGVNRLFGEPIFQFKFMKDTPLEFFGFETVGALVDGPEDTPSRILTPGDPNGTILASFSESAADPKLINVPLQHIETWVWPPDLSTRSDVPFELDSTESEATQAEPNNTITKGDWLSASGKLKVKCGKKGNSVRIHVKGLLPHRLYTVWGIWLTPPEHADGPGFKPYPLGGAPNAYVTDEKGDAIFERDLKFCLTDAAKDGVDGRRLAIIDTHLHSDHVAYGGLPAPLAGGFPPGTVLHAQLEWDLGAGERQ